VVPITTDYFSSDLASDLALPVIVVVHNRLGCLNHTFLTVRSIAAGGLNCAGLVLNDLGAADDDIAFQTNAAILRSCLTLPLLEKFDPESAEIPAALGEMLGSVLSRQSANE